MLDLLPVVALNTSDGRFGRGVALLDRVVADDAVAVIRFLIGQSDRVGFIRVGDFRVGRPTGGLDVGLRVALTAGLDGLGVRLL